MIKDFYVQTVLHLNIKECGQELILNQTYDELFSTKQCILNKRLIEAKHQYKLYFYLKATIALIFFRK